MWLLYVPWVLLGRGLIYFILRTQISIGKMWYAHERTSMFAFCREFLQYMNFALLHFLLQAYKHFPIKLTFTLNAEIILYLLAWQDSGASDWSKNFFDTCINRIFAGLTFLICSNLTLFIEGEFKKKTKTKHCQHRVKLCLFNCQQTYYNFINKNKK